MDRSLREAKLGRIYREGPDPRREEIESIADEDARLEALERYEYGRDYDRLLYSSAFRKLGGVTQVLASSRELGDFHNRLTHSLKVAQTGVRLARSLLRSATPQEEKAIDQFGGLHPGAVRAACLAHDFGHPPFGHLGESALRDVCADPTAFIPDYQGDKGGLPDLFEGNAQTFRIVTRLSFRESPLAGSRAEMRRDNPALNLTKATRAAICKYPWTLNSKEADIKGRLKWGAYETERNLLRTTLAGLTRVRKTKLYGRDHTETRTIEAQIMDLADDIAYAVHDIEDFYRAGLIPLHELKKYGSELESFLVATHSSMKRTDSLPLHSWIDDAGTRQYGDPMDLGQLKEVLERFGYKKGVFSGVPGKPYDGSSKSRQGVHLFASQLIERASSGLVVSSSGVVQYEDPSTHVAIEVLKRLTKHYVVDQAVIESAQFGQRRVIVQLVGAMFEWLRKALGSNSGALPPRLHDYYELNSRLNSHLHGHRRIDESSVMLRTVVDYVASMTDDQAQAWHERINLGVGRSMLDRQLLL